MEDVSVEKADLDGDEEDEEEDGEGSEDVGIADQAMRKTVGGFEILRVVRVVGVDREC